MKVAFVVESFAPAPQVSGGVRVSVRKLAEQLGRKRAVVVIAPHKVFPRLRRYAAARENQGDRSGFCTAEGNVRVYRPLSFHVPVLGVILEPLQMAFWTVAVCAFRDKRVRLLHAHRCYPAGYAACLAAPFLRLPVLLSTYGSDVNAGLSRGQVGLWVSSATRFALRRANGVLAVSRALAERVEQAGVERESVHVVPSGVDTSQISDVGRSNARSRLGVPVAARVVLFAANLVPVKDPFTMLEAFAILKRTIDGVVLAVLGTGELKAAVERKSAELGLSGSVEFLGRRPREEVPLWLAAADVVTLSSTEEGSPVIALEALAAGRPFVGTSVGGLPETVPAWAGILVEPRNPAALAGALKQALENEWDARELASYARQFSWENIGPRIENLYGRLARTKRRAA